MTSKTKGADRIEKARRKALTACITKWRKRRNVGKRELARLMDRHEMWFFRVETGQRLDVAEFLRLAEVLEFDSVKCIDRLRRGRVCCP